MRYIIYGMTCLMITFYTLMAMQTIDARGSRESELSDALKMVMKGTILQMQREGRDESEAKEILDKRLERLIGAESNVRITNLMLDCEKGIMHVEVEETFDYPIGKEGKIQLEETVLVD